jgi:hypothetical protein
MRYLYKHRRGFASQIQNATKPPQDGELVIEYSDDYSVAHLIVGNKNGYDVIDVAISKKIRTASLLKNAWVGDSSPWSQVVQIPSVTINSKIELQPTVFQLASLQSSRTSLTIENNDGAVTVYATGGLPTENYEMRVLITD